MNVIKDQTFAEQANHYKRELLHVNKVPVATVSFEADALAFQGLGVRVLDRFRAPVTLRAGDGVILDFGDHCVGYLHYALRHPVGAPITDSPVRLRFSFGEFPLEIVKPEEEYRGWLGNGWRQQEERAIVYTPYEGLLERRYSFRYLKIERVDNAAFAVELSDAWVDCTTAVDLLSVKRPDIKDEQMRAIFDVSLKTLADCEQDVFEDGPKRDRRLWIGDLRLQALTDHLTFGNTALVKRCLYLFAAYRKENGAVASYVFPDSPPYIDGGGFADYSLLFISCLYDYAQNGGEREVIEQLYPIALEQMRVITPVLPNAGAFIDWCPNLDKEIGLIGVYIYTLRQLTSLSRMLGKSTDEIERNVQYAERLLSERYSPRLGLYVTTRGQVSVHSQIWAVLSGSLTREECVRLLERVRDEHFEYHIHTPYMMHYYIEALYRYVSPEVALEYIKTFWGEIVRLGFDCCPEIFNPDDHFDSPYNAPEFNSACHAWSCTPAYWIARYLAEKGSRGR